MMVHSSHPCWSGNDHLPSGDKLQWAPHLISTPFLTELIELAGEVGLKQTCEQHRTGSRSAAHC